jgi:hypothetical protein
MPRMPVQVRTRDDLRELLAAGASSAWRISEDRREKITHVHVVNFDGTQRIEGVFDRNGSSRREEDGRLTLRFLDGRIVNCQVDFDGKQNQQPVHYLESPNEPEENASA